MQPVALDLAMVHDKGHSFPRAPDSISTSAGDSDAEYQLVPERAASLQLENKDAKADAAAVAEFAQSTKRGSKDAVAIVTALLQHKAWEVRAAAIEALTKVADYGDEDSSAAITKCLLDDSDPVVKYTAWEALGEMEEASGWGAGNSPRFD